MWAAGTNPDIKKVPNIFQANGYWAVSKELGDVLRQFDLGQTKFYPVELFCKDKVTPIKGTHEFLNLFERKDTFEPELSAKFRESRYHPPGTYFAPYAEGGDYELTLNSSALSGPDLWLETKLHEALLLSDRLVKALEAAGFAKEMRLLKCRVSSQPQRLSTT